PADHHTLEDLDAGPVAFDHPGVHLERVPCPEVGDVGPLRQGLQRVERVHSVVLTALRRTDRRRADGPAGPPRRWRTRPPARRDGPGNLATLPHPLPARPTRPPSAPPGRARPARRRAARRAGPAGAPRSA